MASTYSTNLKIELIGTGEQSGIWGATTNVNLGTALEQALVGRGTANFTTDADLTLTLTNSNAAQVARAFVLNVTSGVSLTTTRNLVVPTINKPYIIQNNTTGAQSIVVKTAAGSGVTVLNGQSAMVYADGTNVIRAFGYQDTLVSGTNIKTINGNNLLGAGNVTIQGGITYARYTSNYTAADKDGIIADTSGGSFTVTLPATPTTGFQVYIADGADWGTNNLTVARNGSTIEGLAEDLILDITGAAVQFIYDGTTWEVFAQVGGGTPFPDQGGNSGKFLTTNGTDLSWGDAVTPTGTQTLSNKTLTAPESTGAIYDNGSVRSNIVAVPALNIDCSLGNYFTKTISANSTFTVSNVPASRAYAFTLELTHTSGTVTWFSGVQWPNQTAPTLTTGRTHLFVFCTDDGGTRWRGIANTNYTT